MINKLVAYYVSAGVEDRYYRKLATEALEKFRNYTKTAVKFFKNTRSSYLSRSETHKGFIIPFEEIDPTYSDLYIILLPKNSRFQEGIGTKQTGGKTIVLILLKALNGDFDLTHADMNFQKTSFIHEFIHYLDQKRYKGKTKWSSKVNTFTDYYNNPAEFNAFYQEGAESVEALYQNVFKKTKGNIPIPFKKALKTVNAFYKFSITLFHKAFIENLNSRYRKKFLKRFAALYKEIKKKYKE